jgi:hypothetical protein
MLRRVRFCPKLPQRVSHSAGLDPDGGIRRTFLEAVRLFGIRLGPCFLMLSQRFAPSQHEALERFLDALHMFLATPTAFVRFVGNAPHPSDSRRIADWVDRIVRWADSGLQELHFFIHQSEERRTLGLAEELEKKLADRGLSVSP